MLKKDLPQGKDQGDDDKGKDDADTDSGIPSGAEVKPDANAPFDPGVVVPATPVGEAPVTPVVGKGGQLEGAADTKDSPA